MKIGELGPVLRGPSVVAVTGKYHGLGNRLRSVLGAYSLAQYEQRKFAYTWPTGREFGAPFSDLWEFDAISLPVALSTAIRPFSPWKDHTLEWRDGAARRQRIWQIRTPHALKLPPNCVPWEARLRDIRPTAPLRSEIINSFNRRPRSGPYVGIMIRTNPIAHAETLRHSPLEWFLSRMSEIRESYRDMPFYVSADTKEGFQAVNGHFDHCFGFEDKGSYNSAAALAGSVVDLYMLASSAHVIGPYYSSFPELAQSLAGPSLLLETSKSPPGTVLYGDASLTLPADPLKPHARYPSPWNG